MLLCLSVADRAVDLDLTTNQTTVCLGDYYYLLCSSQEPFGRVCSASTVNWFNGGDRISFPNSNYKSIPEGSTVLVLKFLITEDEFHEPQNFQCGAFSCMSAVVTVGNYSEFHKPGSHYPNL